MGRPAADDPALFQAAAAAGALAARTAIGRRRRRWLTGSNGWSTSPRRCSTPAARSRLDELAERVEPRYPDDKAARRRQFERDKETLRELGIPIRVETVDGFGAEQAYRIHPDDYYLPDLGAHRRRARRAARGGHRGPTRGRRRAARAWPSSAGSTGEGADAALAELDGDAPAWRRSSTR